MHRAFILLGLLFAFAPTAFTFRVAKKQYSTGDEMNTAEVFAVEGEGTSVGDRRRRRRRDGDDRRRRDRRRTPPVNEPPRRRSSPSPPTPPVGGGSCLHFLFLGDFGRLKDGQKETAAGMAKLASELNPEAIWALGDNIYDRKPTKDEMVKFWLEPYPKKHSSLRRPWHGVMGNHDWAPDARPEVEFTTSSKNEGKYWQTPSLWYKKSFASSTGTTVDFFAIDGEVYKGKNKEYVGSGADDKHAKWLDSELGSSSADWKVVVGHFPAYIWTRRRKKVVKESHGNLHDLLKKHRVPLYGCGHFHHLGTLIGDNGLRSFISGGGYIGVRNDCVDPSGNNLAYCGSGGFHSLKFCDKASAELTLYTGDGKARSRVSVPNLGSMTSLADDVPDAEAPYAEDVSMDGTTFIPFTAGLKPVVCNGVELGEVDRVCAQDRCTVTVENYQLTCEQYCAKHRLACVGGWTQTEDGEACDILEAIGCHQAEVYSTHDKMCQCA